MNRISDEEWASRKNEVARQIARAFDFLGMEATLKVLADEAGKRARTMDDEANRVMTEVDGVARRVFMRELSV